MIKSIYPWTILDTIKAPIPNAIVDGPFGSNLKIKDYINDGIPVLQGKNITNNKFKWFDMRFISETKAFELKRSTVVLGDILIIKIGSIGYSAELTDLKGYPYAIIPANLAKVTPDESKVMKKYLCFWLNSLFVSRYLKRIASKTAQPALSLTKIKELPLPLPPLDTQKKIATVLDSADQLRQKRKQAIEKLDQLLQSVFLDMFGDPVKNPRGWKYYTLPQLASNDKYAIKRGPFGGALKKEIFVKEGYLVYEQYHAINDDYSLKRYFITKQKYKELKMFKVKPRDLIISCSGVTLGRISEIPPNALPGIINQALLKLSLDRNKINNSYFKCLFRHKSTQNKLFGISRGSGIPNFPSMKEIKLINFMTPPIELQNNFSQILNKIEMLRNNINISKLDNIFNSLIQRAFKGELKFNDKAFKELEQTMT